MRTSLAIVVLILCCAPFVGAQSLAQQKFGFADPSYIFSQMPQYKQIENELKTHNEQLTAQANAKYKEYETKLKAYEAGAATMLDAVRKDKENELLQLRDNIQKFEAEAQSAMQQKQASLTEPVFKKIKEAVKEVAKEHGYTFILNPRLQGGIDILLFGEDRDDVSALVLKKLGITPAAATTSKPNTPKE